MVKRLTFCFAGRNSLLAFKERKKPIPLKTGQVVLFAGWKQKSCLTGRQV
jgi:hypothetical protein